MYYFGARSLQNVLLFATLEKNRNVYHVTSVPLTIWNKSVINTNMANNIAALCNCMPVVKRRPNRKCVTRVDDTGIQFNRCKPLVNHY